MCILFVLFTLTAAAGGRMFGTPVQISPSMLMIRNYFPFFDLKIEFLASAIWEKNNLRRFEQHFETELNIIIDEIMVVTNNHELPTFEELTVEEVPISTPGLRAAAHHLGKYCLDVNDDFVMCKQEMNDPRKCLNEGKAVTSCALQFFRSLKGNCYDEFQIYSNCIDKSSNRLDFEPCRKTQAVYDKCVFEKMGIERPEFGFFCKPRVYTGSRPKPPPEEPQIFGDLPVGLKDFKDEERPPAKYGQRNWFIK